MVKSILAILLSAAVAGSCDKGEGPQDTHGQELQLNETDREQIVQTNAFTASLFLEATKDLESDENAFLSPLGVSAVMAMTYNGAGGETKDAIANAFGFDQISNEDLNAYYQTLIKGLPLVNPQTELLMGNAIWYNENMTLKPDFLKISKRSYLAKAGKLDFTDPRAKDAINDWVTEQTKGKIEKIIEQTQADDLAYLLNAIYFKGMWEHKFDKEKTEKADFRTASDQVVQTDFMQNRESYRRLTMEALGLEAVEISYTDNKFSMVLVRPTDALTHDWDTAELADFVKALGTEQATFRSGKIDLYIPKFKFSYERKLNDDLTNMGMGVAFQDNADFSNLSGQTAKISEVKHKAFVEVDEEGTEAAAVTNVGAVVTSAPIIPKVRFDRPFVFLIKENASNLILFVGKVNNPLSSETEG